MALPRKLAWEIKANVRNYATEQEKDFRVEIEEPETAVIIRAKRLNVKDLEFLQEQAKGFSHFVECDKAWLWVRFCIW